MSQNFIACDRDQAYLMPPSLLDWVAEDHLVWSVLGSVEELDLTEFYTDYRADGHGRPAYDPEMVACFCTRTRAGCAPPAGSSGRAGRMSRSA
jgi:transposase